MREIFASMSSTSGNKDLGEEDNGLSRWISNFDGSRIDEASSVTRVVVQQHPLRAQGHII